MINQNCGLKSYNDIAKKYINSSEHYQSNSNLMNFSGNEIKQIDKDTVDLKNKSETNNTSKLQKLATASAIALLTGVGLTLGISRHNYVKLKKLYEKSVYFATLPENIDFIPAQTLEEAVKFTKEVLGINKVDEKLNLEALNFVNKGIVDVSNANKGKLYLPKELKAGISEKWAAWVNHNIKNEDFFKLGINMKEFNKDDLIDKLGSILKPANDASNAGTKKLSDECRKFVESFIIDTAEAVKKLKDKFLKSPEELSLSELRELALNIKNVRITRAIMLNDPIEALNKLTNMPEFQKLGIKIPSSDDLAQLSNDDQYKKVAEIFNTFEQKTGNKVKIMQNDFSLYAGIYHELGHLQDYGKHLATLDLKDTFWGKLIERNVDKIGNMNVEQRFISKFKNKDLQDVLQKCDEQTIKTFIPEFYEFNLPQNQKIAAKISQYAKNGIGEFIAETYAQMVTLFVQGKDPYKELPQDVLSMYKRFNGPEFGECYSKMTAT